MEDKAIKIVGLGAEAMEKYVAFKYYELWFNTSAELLFIFGAIGLYLYYVCKCRR